MLDKLSFSRTLSSIGALLLSYWLFIMANGLFTSLIGLRTQVEGYSDLLVGFLVACYFTGMLVGALVGTKILLYGGYIRSFAAFASMMSVCALIHILWVNPWIWMFARALAGFCMATLLIITESWLNQSASNHTRGRILSYYMITNYLGSGLGQSILPLSDPSEPYLFATVSLLFSLALIPVLLNPSGEPVVNRTKPTSLKTLYRISPLSIVCVFCAGWISANNNGLGAVFAHKLGLSIQGTSLFMFCLVFSGLLLQWPVGYISDHIDRRKVMLVVTLITLAVSLALTLFIPHIGYWGWAPLFVLIIIYGSHFFTLYPIGSAHMADNVSAAGGSMAGVARGVLIAYGCGAVIGPITAGQMMEKLGPQGFTLNAAIMLTLLSAYILYRSTRRTSVGSEYKRPFIPMAGINTTVGVLAGGVMREMDRTWRRLLKRSNNKS